MNSFAISANSAWNTLNVISDRAWQPIEFSANALTCPRAIAIYRKIILGAITAAAFVYAAGYASRDVWRWVVAKCDRYLEQCELGPVQGEILDTVEVIGDVVVAVVIALVYGSDYSGEWYSRCIAFIRPYAATIESSYRLLLSLLETRTRQS